MHEPYEERLKHQADFRVKYKFRDSADGGRARLPYQGLRCDFTYSEEKGEKIYMIWPEFEDINKKVILENDIAVPKEGTARMWIINPERRIIHKEKIKPGIKCFFWEGKITADCEIIEVISLFENPVALKTNRRI